MSFGNQSFDDHDEVLSEINMTPLVDVMLVLLIIFIITVPVLTHSVNVDLPTANNAPSRVKPETITLAVTADGQIHWNNETLAMPILEKRLAAVALQQPQPEVHLQGDRSVDYGHVVAVMAAVQRAGLTKLGFVTEPEGRE